MTQGISRRLEPARIGLSILALVTTLAASYAFARVLGSHGVKWLFLPSLALFALLFFWIAVSFWTASLGFVKCLLHRGPRRAHAPPAPAADDPTAPVMPPTAILMPIYNENPTHVFAGLRATLESLRDADQGHRFDLFILSDTTDPETWLEEERAWAALKTAFDAGTRIYYRRRPRNAARKSGNIADFCEGWGGSYRYMLILDADSVMEGSTIVEMVRRMERDDRIGILQAPVVPVNNDSLLARCQQFAARMYGEIFTSGFALWTGSDGNYYGHNALIRVEPFIRHCGLPSLPGRAPLGGEILSHDFVEAALMRRAGWKVVMADDLTGSYEECPTTLTDFAKRDQRWCQGNMQHIRLVFTCGLHPMSRVHLGMGAMSYLSSPLWLLLMVLAIGAAISPGSVAPGAASGGAAPAASAWYERHLALMLFGFTMALLLLPKLWGYLLLLTDRPRREAQGGAARAGLSVLLDTAVCMLTAPVMMAFHSAFVISTLFGHTIEWLPQRRHAAGVALRDAIQAHAIHTLAGLLAAFGILLFTPGLFWWMLPVLAGLILSIPLALLLGSVRAGRHLAARGLLLIPEETHVPEVLQRQRMHHEAAESTRQSRQGRSNVVYQVVVDPAFLATHVAILRAAGGGTADVPPDLLERIRQIAFHGSPLYLTRKHQLAMLSDETSLRRLHEQAWSCWPLSVLNGVEPALAPPFPWGDAAPV